MNENMKWRISFVNVLPHADCGLARVRYRYKGTLY